MAGVPAHNVTHGVAIIKAYLDLVRRVLAEGERKENRTGTAALAVAGAYFEHDMHEGFPLLTTKKVPFRLVSSELEFFLRGLTDKAWLQDRNNHIWDEWCAPGKVAYGHDKATRQRMLEERDLGPVYGYQWRHFGADYPGLDGLETTGDTGVDQIMALVQTLKTDPDSRRMLVTAWNPQALKSMALPPCHYGFQVTVIQGRLNLLWNQRSVDVALGLPFNIASYGLLLHLLAQETGLKEGRLIGFLGDVHIYENHVEGLRQQISRSPRPLPSLLTEPFTSLLEWHYEDSRLEGYQPDENIRFEIAV